MQDLSTDRDATRAAIDTYKTAGGTALFDAVADALARLETAEGRRVVVAMTDGRDENNPGTAPGSRRSLDDVLRAVKSQWRQPCTRLGSGQTWMLGLCSSSQSCPAARRCCRRTSRSCRRSFSG